VQIRNKTDQPIYIDRGSCYRTDSDGARHCYYDAHNPTDSLHKQRVLTIPPRATRNLTDYRWIRNPQNNIVGTIADTGQCNAQGVYSTKFAGPAIFTVTARIDEPDTVNVNKRYYREGERSIRLKTGELVTTTVKVTGPKTLGRADFQDI
jgi:hypothetical protein